jgi:chromosome segregation ATPase
MACQLLYCAFMRKVSRKPSDQVPMNKRMLFEVRNELKNHTSQRFHSLNSDFSHMKSDIIQIKGDIVQVKAAITVLKSDVETLKQDMTLFKSDIGEIKSQMMALKSDLKTEIVEEIKTEFRSQFHSFKSDLHGIKSAIHAMKLMMEEQNARNVIVLDGLMGYYERTARREDRIDHLEHQYPKRK